MSVADVGSSASGFPLSSSSSPSLASPGVISYTFRDACPSALSWYDHVITPNDYRQRYAHLTVANTLAAGQGPGPGPGPTTAKPSSKRSRTGSSSGSSSTTGPLSFQSSSLCHSPTPIPSFPPAGPAPIVIDAGSYETRAGWADQQAPQLRFRSLLSRSRIRRDGDYLLVGNQLTTHVDDSKQKIRSPYTQQILTQPEAAEGLLDSVFVGLGLSSCSRVDHPVLLTEPICNPNWSRAQIAELLFECYQVPLAGYGIDCLFSQLYNQIHGHIPAAQDSLIISCGYDTTHVVPFVCGEALFGWTSRLGVGSVHGHQLMFDTLQLQYPHLTKHITQARAQELAETFGAVADESLDEGLRKIALFQANAEQTQASLESVMIQLPFHMPTQQGEATAEELEAKAAKKQAHIEKLKARNKQRNAEKLSQNLADLAQYEQLLEQAACGAIADNELAYAVSELGFEGVAEFRNIVSNLRKKVAKATGQVLAKPKLSEEEEFPLLHVPDEHLTPDELKEKRKQRFIKATREGREKKREAAESEAAQALERVSASETEKLADPEAYVRKLMEQQQALVARREARTAKVAQATAIAGVGRRGRSSLSAARLALLAKLSADDGTDDKQGFGDDDQDWDEYRQVDRDRDAEQEHEQAGQGAGDLSMSDMDSEGERAELSRVTRELHTLRPDLVPASALPSSLYDHAADLLTMQQQAQQRHQIHLHTHRYRVGEVLFCPSLVGVPECGLPGLIGRTLSRLDPFASSRVTCRVFVTGGGSLLPGFVSRLQSVVTQCAPFRQPVHVYHAQDPTLDAWRGARQFANDLLLSSAPGSWCSYFVSRAEYDECGPDYFKQHRLGNRYNLTPIPVPVDGGVLSVPEPDPAAAEPAPGPGRKRKPRER